MPFPLKKELKESTRHGSSVYPLAGYVCSARRHDINIGMHWHPEVEINRFEKGSFIYNYAMRDYELTGPCIAIVPGNVLHNVQLKKGSSQSSAVFSLAMLQMSYADAVLSDINQIFANAGNLIPQVMTPDMPHFAQTDSLLAFVIENAASEKAAVRLRVKASLMMILSLMYESGVFMYEPGLRTDDLENRQSKLKALLSYISENYDKKLSMNDAADYLNVSKQYFCRYFRKSTGMSFVDFVNDLRLRRAGQEILLTSKSMNEIAKDSGFDNVGYFFKLFRQKYGQTPRAYRILNRDSDDTEN